MRFMKTFLPAVLLGWISLAGCTKKPTDVEALMQRANAYWDAATVFDLATMYDMEVQALDGSYMAADAVQVLASPTRVATYKLANPKIDGDTATIDLDLQLKISDSPAPGWSLPPRPDFWTKIDGVWYHGKHAVPAAEPPKTPPATMPVPKGT